jgi:hypothetical protein
MPSMREVRSPVVWQMRSSSHWEAAMRITWKRPSDHPVLDTRIELRVPR